MYIIHVKATLPIPGGGTDGGGAGALGPGGGGAIGPGGGGGGGPPLISIVGGGPVNKIKIIIMRLETSRLVYGKFYGMISIHS